MSYDDVAGFIHGLTVADLPPEVVEAAELEAAVVRAAGGPPRELRLLRTEKGVVAFLTLGLDPDSTLADAHARASEVEERLRRARPDVADVIVHTEP